MPNRRILENLNIFENVLETAIENVKCHADSTWNFSEYQQANQGLLKQIEELEHNSCGKSTKVRNVKDCIPNSKLAKYGNYEYDESRELCYASSVSDVSFYYPCIYKRNCIVEPWMLPEVEQVFIWLTYSADFSLLEPLNLEDLKQLDDEEAAELEKYCSGGSIFHEIKPLIYENVERAPGKSRYTQCSSKRSETTSDSFPERKHKNVDLQEMLVENRVKCEQVKRLWYDSTVSNDLNDEEMVGQMESRFKVFKSPLGNYFTFENMKNMRNIPKVFKVDGNGKCFQSDTQDSVLDGLKSLTDAFAALEESLMNHTYSKKKVTQLKQNSGRRLYSAVVQGVPSKPLLLTRINESTDTLSLANIRSVVSLDELTEQKSVQQKFPVQLNVCQEKCQMDILLKKTKELGKSVDNDARVNTTTFSSPVNSLGVVSPANNSFFGSSSNAAASSTHLLLNNYNTSGNCLMNLCGNTYLQNHNNLFPPAHTMAQNARQSFTNNLLTHQPLWLLQQQQQQQQQQQLRHQSYYSTSNCHGFMYLPSAIRTRNPQRWPPFLKPLASCVPSSSNTPFQTWNQNPCTYKGHPTQYFNSKQSNDASRSKNTGSRQNPHSLKPDRISKPSIDDSSKDSSSKNSSYSSDNVLHAPPPVPRIRYFYRSGTSSGSTGDDLERQAIEQYQMSDENFCKELEQQAIEQYENSENWKGPSNKFLLFGGLIYKYFIRAIQTFVCDFYNSSYVLNPKI